MVVLWEAAGVGAGVGSGVRVRSCYTGDVVRGRQDASANCMAVDAAWRCVDCMKGAENVSSES